MTRRRTLGKLDGAREIVRFRGKMKRRIIAEAQVRTEFRIKLFSFALIARQAAVVLIQIKQSRARERERERERESHGFIKLNH